MTSVTNIEPFATGRVVLKTTRGDIQLELWCTETPKACRNFIQLCMEGYYDGTIIHRIVPNYIIQGGDPTGTGQGGESIYDKPFPVETHPRLRFTRRGLVAMANADGEGNGSQFFITLNATPELAGKHTLFARVVGDTIYNVVRISELELDATERPVYPPKIVETQVIENPFTDIQPRTNRDERQRVLQEQRERQKKQERAALLKKGTRNKTFLSFGDEVEIPLPKKKIRPPQNERTKKEEKDEGKDERIQQPSVATKETPVAKKVPITSSTVSSASLSSLQTPVSTETKSVKQEIARLKAELRQLDKRPLDVDSSASKRKQSAKKRNALQEELEQFKATRRVLPAKKKLRQQQEDSTFDVFLKFQQKIRSASDIDDSAATKTNSIDETPCTLHNIPACYSCYDRLGETNENDKEDAHWFAHRLVSDKRSQ
ncbi:cyclophilin family peptidyl-prolyl cis-trans isomerase Cyp7 [Schizosaccharomyces japonicus yFS275]|uniref:Cyclophilin family peptidyl-prolyl cis-trans isomerase Cyp7 n=1 Tax=Schizosaccharomyces japonicus (strain yFS275 / FY16936) TaxID=402676 RepID=B6JW34_SCHJY|nr:cyclophilin family peptidyl-prolyl cis-trans isomerase Cyp7 [Schizosaccharomyces japonicus yFS275]EEB05585.1 cyclophilin family peptidyl-prolyl cis-trans isomerase Cyp7 [Schizosaccharomyces japonicus yFS275]